MSFKVRDAAGKEITVAGLGGGSPANAVTVPGGAAITMGEGIGAGGYQFKFTPEGDEPDLTASDVGYDHAESGLAATTVQDAVDEVAGRLTNITLDTLLPANAGAHNSIFRGKFLGNSVSSDQYAAISAGTFEDLFVGDYWVIDGINYRIAALDYFLRCGDTDLTTHHAVIVPDTSLYTHVMNDSNTTDGGYYGSKMRTSGLNSAKASVASAFGASHILSHRELLTNAVANGRPSGTSWYDCTVELMNEVMVYGHSIFLPSNDGTNVPYKYTVSKGQLPLFAHRHDLIGNRENWWLMDIATAAGFARVNHDGVSTYEDASLARGVRPFFCIYGGDV